MNQRLLLRGARVFDGTGAALADADIVIEGDRILDVGNGLDGDAAMDLNGSSVCPGIIDCHVHVMVSHIDMWRLLQEPASLVYYQAAKNLGRLLDAGITTARDAAGADLGTKRAVDLGLVRGPRLLIAITLISQTGGHSDGLLPSGCSLTVVGQPVGMPHPVADGVEELRKKVREVLRAGADVIKVASSGGVMSPSDDPRHAHYTLDELTAAVDEARRAGSYVMAHAQATDGIKNAVRAGVRSIEHGVYLDDEAIALMLERGTYLVPTLMAAQSVKAAVGGPGMMEAAAAKVESIIDVQRQSFRAALAAGVPIAMGTDAVGYPHGRNLEELSLMVSEGMPTLAALASATGSAAQLLGIADDVGTLMPGKRADLTVFAGDLGDNHDLADLGARLTHVFQSGKPAFVRPGDVGTPMS